MKLFEIVNIQLPNLQQSETGIPNARYVNYELGLQHRPRLKIYLWGENTPRSIHFKVKEIKDEGGNVHYILEDNSFDKKEMSRLPDSELRKKTIKFIQQNVDGLSKYCFGLINRESFEQNIQRV